MYYDKQTDKLYDNELAMEGFFGNLKDTIATIIEKLIHKIIDLARFITKKKSVILLDPALFKEFGIQTMSISELQSQIKMCGDDAKRLKRQLSAETDESKMTEYKVHIAAINEKISIYSRILYRSKTSTTYSGPIIPVIKQDLR